MNKCLVNGLSWGLMFMVPLLLFSCERSSTQPLPESGSLEQLVGDAELVFQGTVQNIEYHSSIEGIPHTFVTYNVEDVIKGQYQNATITLRFVGGYKQDGDRTIRLQVSHSPEFTQGEQGILMVRGNGQALCPLNGCVRGHFRIEDGYVTDASGNLLATDAKGAITRIANPQHQRTVEGVGDADSGAEASVSGESIDSTPMDRQVFAAYLRGLIGKQRSRSLKGTASSVVSADPSKPFKGPQALAEGPPKSVQVPFQQRRAEPSRPSSDFDRWEEEEFRKNGGNPVLKKNKYPGIKDKPALGKSAKK